MELRFGYAKTEQVVQVPDKNLIGVLTANEMEHTHPGEEAVRYALQNPIGATEHLDIRICKASAEIACGGLICHRNTGRTKAAGKLLGSAGILPRAHIIYAITARLGHGESLLSHRACGAQYRNGFLHKISILSPQGDCIKSYGSFAFFNETEARSWLRSASRC
jgi:hypothetical protein